MNNLKSVIDLTHTIHPAMPTSPTDFGVRLQRIKNRTLHGYEDHLLTINMHSGTHMDLPGHFLNHDQTFATLSLDKCIYQALKFTDKTSKVIPILKGMDAIKPGMAVVIATGHDTQFNHPSYYQDYPVLSPSLITYLVEKEVSLIALDTPSPDTAPFDAHYQLFNHNVLIVENLKNALNLPDNQSFTLYAIPLNIDASGCPVRVFAKLT